MQKEVMLLFREVADLSPAERDRYFEQHQVRPEIRADLESLLRYDSGTALPLAQAIASEAQAYLAPAEAAGRICGPYRLMRLLGRGGAGDVYLAERIDGQVKQRVAVKLLRQDSESRSFHARFLQERQILASLQHPGIATLLDAGQTGDGKAYLVMEYVDGVTIDVYCASLDLRARLSLFLQVCEAVSFAHRNLIIHRDLKPSNILVDNAGRPRLLDFGIAKILDAPADQTRTQERQLTPDYASPEQVRGATQTTATDIYSLGAVLYHLLTGRSPHAFPARTPEAIGTAICMSDPVPASRLNPELPTDLDFILRKALRKEPEERYGSVEALADDIRAFLEWRPIRARSGDAWYRTRKFARRYRGFLAAAFVTMLALSAGLYVANRQRIVAEERFRQLHLLAAKVFDLDAKISRLPGSTEARQDIVSASLEYLSKLGASARGDLDLSQEIGAAYMQVARVQGVPGRSNLGNFAGAEESLRKGDSFINAVLASRPRNASALILSAGIANDRMIVAETERRHRDARVHAANAAAKLERFLHAGGFTPAQRTAAAAYYINLGIELMNLHEYEAGRQRVRSAMEAAASLPDEAQFRASGLSLIGNAFRSEGHLEEALTALRDARRTQEQAAYSTSVDRDRDRYGILLREARTLGQPGGVSLGRAAEAMAVYQELVDMEEQAAAKDLHDQDARDRLSMVSCELAQLLEERDPERALAMFDLGIRRLREAGNVRVRRREAKELADSSYALRRLGRAGEARQRIDAAFALLRETKDFPAQRLDLDSEAVAVLCAQADYESTAGNPRRAVAIYEQLLAAIAPAKTDPLNDLSNASRISLLYAGMAAAYRHAGDPGKAAGMDERRLQLWRHWEEKLPHNAYVERQMAVRAE